MNHLSQIVTVLAVKCDVKRRHYTLLLHGLINDDVMRRRENREQLVVTGLNVNIIYYKIKCMT